MTANCPHCQAALAPDARFCPSCGKAAQATTPEPAASGPLRAQNEMIGREIAGRFRILALLGEGGMGAVYRGEQLSLRRAVAIKVLRPEMSANQMLLARFSAEAQAVAKLDHPNTVKVYDFGQDSDGSLFIAMELIDGKPLRSVIGAAGPLPPARAFNIALQVAASLVDAHAANIVHRDLKPDNVMLVDKGRQKDVVRVLDFGIAKLRDDSRATQQAMTQAGDMLGTPQYMAPEQIKGEAIDGRTDVYALGCMLYEMVTARLPFEAPSIMAMLSKHLMEMPLPPSQRRPDLAIAPAIDHVVMAALQKAPGARPANMEHYAEMLAAVLAQLPPDSKAMTAPQQPTPAAMPVVETPIPASMIASTPIPPTARVAQPYSPYPPPAYAYPPPPSPPPKKHVGWFIAIGAIVLVGAGVGVYSASQKTQKTGDDDSYKAKIEKPEPEPVPVPVVEVTKPDVPEPPPTTGSADPWNVPEVAHPATPPVESVGTRETPIPESAHLDPPAGFVRIDAKRGWQAYGSEAAKLFIVLAPLPAGTNEPTELARRWISTNADEQLVLKSQTKNQDRPMLSFEGMIDNTTTVSVYMTMYITNRYRLAYIVVAVKGDTNPLIDRLIYSGVTWP
ncbi:MAG: serine/threonine-protein kinase [Kofleriaceae bacterium]